MLIVGLILLVAASFVLVWLLIAGPVLSRRQARDRLRGGLEAERPQSSRVVTGRRGSFSVLAAGFLPASARGMIGRLLVRAGRPPEWPVERVIAAKFVLLVVFGAISLAMIPVLRTPIAVLLGLVLTALAFFFPELRLWSLGIERRESISLQLPDTLDQMSIAVRAGLGFDAAMIRVARNRRGELAQELIRTMQDIQVGQPRRNAYLDLGERTGVPELRRFMRSIAQAETYGLPLADVLHTQADEMRIRRRQLAESKAMEIPVKVVFPLIVFILPALLIVVVGPAAINIITSLGSLGG